MIFSKTRLNSGFEDVFKQILTSCSNNREKNFGKSFFLSNRFKHIFNAF